MLCLVTDESDEVDDSSDEDSSSDTESLSDQEHTSDSEVRTEQVPIHIALLMHWNYSLSLSHSTWLLRCFSCRMMLLLHQSQAVTHRT